MLLDFQKLTTQDRYKLMSNTISPRPIAWIVTQDKGIINIAPFSYFTPLTSSPPTLVVSIGHKSDGTPKDTLANILENKKATICLAEKEFMEKMSKSANPLPKEVSESIEFNIETLHVNDDYPPIIKGVKVAFFCDFYDTFPIENSPTIPVFLTIKEMFSSDERVNGLHVNTQNIGRVGKNYIFDYKSHEQ